MDKILISGASSGLGLEICKKLSEDYYIICFSRKIELLKKYFDKKKNIEFYELDLTNLIKSEKFIKKIYEKHKNISILINNAAQIDNKPMEKLNIKKASNIFKLNVLAPALFMKYFIKNINFKKDYGRIVNITSGAPLNCFPNYSLYSSSKSALNSISITAAKEVNKNITINLLSPGPIKTKMTSGMKAKFFSMDQCISDIKKLISKKNDINGKFIWRGKIIPLLPNLKDINWLKGEASKKYKKI